MLRSFNCNKHTSFKKHFFFSTAKPHPLLMSFSMYSNGKNLFKTTKSSEHMKPLDGMRVLSTCWIVLLHTKILLGNHSINPLKALTVR